jgi:hypothetical protein
MPGDRVRHHDHDGEDQTPPQHVGDKSETTEDKEKDESEYEQHDDLLGFRT